jgi:hypothetical protein
MSIIDPQTLTVRYCHVYISLFPPFYIAVQRYQLIQPRETKQVSYMDWIIKKTRSFDMPIIRSPPVKLVSENIHPISCVVSNFCSSRCSCRASSPTLRIVCTKCTTVRPFLFCVHPPACFSPKRLS